MSTITIIEGNSNDKDNTRAYMVKGEKGVSPTLSSNRSGTTTTVTMTDYEGTHTFNVEDGVSPTVTTSKSGKVTTITIVDAGGTHTATINDGDVTYEQLEVGLSGKANTNHTHTKSQITDFAHNHDDRYYTETETDNFLKTQTDTITKTDSSTTYNITFKRNVNVVTVDIEANFPANFYGKTGSIDIYSLVPSWAIPTNTTSATLDRDTILDITSTWEIKGEYSLRLYASTSSYKLNCDFILNSSYIPSTTTTKYFSLRYII